MQKVQLRRTLSLPMMTLYGVGTTVGAGIYVLVGKVAGAAGLFAPVSFVLAALLATFSALSFAELSSRFPRSAGEAIYVSEGLGARRLGTIVGLLVVLSGIVSSATISIGAAGYLNTLVAVPTTAAIVAIIFLLAAIAIWGIREAVTVAALLTLLEVAGLLLVVWVGRDAFVSVPAAFSVQPPIFDLAVLVGVASGVILAFFAFIGFEDMVNVAEEVRDVRRTMPRAIILTLVITTLIYLVVSIVATFSLPLAQISASEAPLALIYTSVTGKPPLPISLIGLVAVVNGALIQIIMGSRVLYGLAQQEQISSVFGSVNRHTRTPIIATVAVSGLVLFFALAMPLENLARLTSLVVLFVFAIVNLALLVLKTRRPAPADAVTVPLWVPAVGFVVSAFFVLFQSAEFALRLI
ncbi:MAG: amino acid permease [Alphaproteobacteria bacterium]|nr:amino acid permease [Alphaproteobacteria bacterium]